MQRGYLPIEKQWEWMIELECHMDSPVFAFEFDHRVMKFDLSAFELGVDA